MEGRVDSESVTLYKRGYILGGREGWILGVSHIVAEKGVYSRRGEG